MKIYTLSPSYSASLFKLFLFMSTITVELLIGYMTSNNDYSAFYLTVLVQSVNNIYDASTYIKPKQYRKEIVFWQSGVIGAAVCALGMSVCYLATQNGNAVHNMLSNDFAILSVCFFTSFIIITLIWDFVTHIIIINKTKMDDSEERGEKIAAYKGITTTGFYLHNVNDEIDWYPDLDEKQSQKVGK